MRRFSHPFETWPHTGRRTALIVVSVLALLPSLAGFVVYPLNDDETGEGIIEFELARTEERSQEILDVWERERVIDEAKAIQVFDLFYPLIYSAALAGGCIAAAGAWRRAGRERLAALGITMAWVAFGAAGFDYLENFGLNIQLWGEVASPWPQIAWFAAICKFAGIAVSLLYALSGLLAAFSTRGRSPASEPPRTQSPGSPSAD